MIELVDNTEFVFELPHSLVFSMLLPWRAPEKKFGSGALILVTGRTRGFDPALNRLASGIFYFLYPSKQQEMG